MCFWECWEYACGHTENHGVMDYSCDYWRQHVRADKPCPFTRNSVVSLVYHPNLCSLCQEADGKRQRENWRKTVMKRR